MRHGAGVGRRTIHREPLFRATGPQGPITATVTARELRRSPQVDHLRISALMRK